MKLRILLFALIAFPAISQTTYQSSKYKPVWYSSTYEKTHGTYALFDTSSIKLQWTTSGKPEMKFFGPTGNTLFYLDSTGTISTGTTSGGLLRADFDDSLNNAHTVTGAWKFNGNVGTIPAGQVSIGKNATNGYIKAVASNGDTMSIWADGNSSRINSTDQLVISILGSNYVFRNTDIYGTNDVTTLGTSSVKFQKGYFTDSLYVAGKGQTATIKWGTMRKLTDTDSSGVLTMSGPNPAVKMQSGTGLLLTYLGQLAPTYNASAWDFWFSTGGSTGQDTLWISIDGTNAVPWLGGSRVAKH